jgi:serine/threonine protein kinase
MAEVYRARDSRLGRDVALKVVNEALAGDPELVRRFEQEARLAGSLNHPNLVAVYDVGLHEGAAYLITELLQGESLRHRLSRARIPLQTALDWGAQLAEGLAAAHARGIIHRDVKPEIVFVTSDGHVKLLDFGIPKLAEGPRVKGHHGILDDTVTPAGGKTRTGAILGTPAYMSPEQICGEQVNARTDIFSLGSVLHEMLSGQRPFPGASLVEVATPSCTTSHCHCQMNSPRPSRRSFGAAWKRNRAVASNRRRTSRSTWTCCELLRTRRQARTPAAAQTGGDGFTGPRRFSGCWPALPLGPSRTSWVETRVRRASKLLR